MKIAFIHSQTIISLRMCVCVCKVDYLTTGIYRQNHNNNSAYTITHWRTSNSLFIYFTKTKVKSNNST